VQSSTAFSNWPSLDRQAARLHSKIELQGSCSRPSLYAIHASVNFDALNNKLPLNLADATALALFNTVLASLLPGSSRAACWAAAIASSNLLTTTKFD
jgi:hypothetical protein